MKRFSLRWLKSIWTIVGAIAAGVVTGLAAPAFAVRLIPYGELYLSLLKMCVIPIMVTAIVSSVGRLFMKSGSAAIVKKMIGVFVIVLVLTGVLGLAAAQIVKPGAGFSEEQRSVLGREVLDAETGPNAAAAGADDSSGLMQFVFDLVPANIFIALGNGDNLQILFFSVVVGAAIGIISAKSEYEGQFLAMADLLFKAFQRIISWAMYVLPLGMFCMMAGQIAEAGADLLNAMLKYIICVYAICLLLMVMGIAVIASRCRMSFFRVLRELKEPLWVAFGTQNSIATMPYVLDVMINRFKLNSNAVNLVVPLGIVLCRYSMIVTYTAGIVFIAQLYGVTLGLQDWLIALAGALLAAIAGAGSPGIVAIAMISMIAEPLQLPYAAGVILLMAVHPIVEPAITTANITLNGYTTVLIAGEQRGPGLFARKRGGSDAAAAADAGAARAEAAAGMVNGP